jgi:Domain of unknown function (DUF6475)
MTKNEFAGAMTILASSYNRELVEAALEGYWLALGDLNSEQLKIGVTRALREWKGAFMPTAPELRALAIGAHTPEQKKLNAAMSWEIVRAAMDKYDYVQTVDFGPLTNAVVRNMGGWQELCDRKKGDLTFDRKRFEDLHISMSETEIDPRRSAPLIGAYFPKPVLFNIPGEPPRRLAITDDKEAAIADLVFELANSKAG